MMDTATEQLYIYKNNTFMYTQSNATYYLVTA